LGAEKTNCYNKGDDIEENEFYDSFPNIAFKLKNTNDDDNNNDMTLSWLPQNYFFLDKEGIYCIGISEGASNIILGTTWMHNRDIIFDNENKKIGFISARCDGTVSNEAEGSYYMCKY